ncbi:MAG: amino acid permease [Nitrososphaerales archaeon]
MTETAPALKRTINLFHATMYGIGLILGAGIFVIIGDAAEIAGNLLWISFIISSFLAICTAFSYAELSSIFPKSAAEYICKKFFGKIIPIYICWLFNNICRYSFSFGSCNRIFKLSFGIFT